MKQRKNEDDGLPTSTTTKSPKGERGRSKKLYFAGGSTRIPRNKARRAARRTRRAAYWKSEAGQERKLNKMSNETKLVERTERRRIKKARRLRNKMERVEAERRGPEQIKIVGSI
jgi:hypothetical protein